MAHKNFVKMACDDTVSILLSGNNPDYVLLKLAIDFAEQGLNIWFISIASFEEIPDNIQQPCKEVLQLITFIYLKDYVDLIKHLNGIHKWKNSPDFIILKDFENYCGLHDVEYNPEKTAFLSSTLLDSVKFLARKNGSITFLVVCCSNLNDQVIIDKRLQILYDMYFDIFLLKKSFESESDLINNIKEKFPLNKTTDK